MTLDEYRSSPLLRRIAYRLFRHPVVMFGLGPLFAFVIGQRFPTHQAGRRQIISVLVTDAGLLAIVVAASLTIGIKAYLLIQLPVIFIAGVL